MLSRRGLVVCFLLALGALAQSALTVTAVAPPIQWQKAELRIQGVPTASNPFDPNLIAVDATIVSPTGATIRVPSFWYEPYMRSLVNGVEIVTPAGAPEWRLRFMPTEIGVYKIAVTAKTPSGSVSGAGTTSVGAKPTGFGAGYAKVAVSGTSFVTTDGTPLPLVGTDVCWDDGPGFAEYSLWFGQMAAAGENFTRVWMCPWAFGIEDDPDTLTNYRLDRAWQLDSVFDLAFINKVKIQLCLDYAGMFAIVPDMWGGDNSWPQNPYNTANGGMCSVPDQFFTSPLAQATYEKRLRYLIARYGYSPNLMSWEFYNELDDSYQTLNPADEYSWLGTVGAWLKANDPFHHLVTTSYANWNQPAVWSQPSIDYVQMHPYAESSPAQAISTAATQLQSTYRKPVLVAEFGMSLTGWNRSTADPYLRGFRQAVWGAALGGSTGTAMSWWWQNVYSEGDQSIYAALKSLLAPTAWETGVTTSVYMPSTGHGAGSIGSPIPGGTPFSAQISLDSAWGAMLSGSLPVPNVGAASQGPNVLDAFVQGAWHPDLQIPFQIGAWFAASGSFTMHLNSASANAIAQVLIDGVPVFTKTYSGAGQLNEQFNVDIQVPVPAGRHVITVQNPGSDWFFLDWVKVTNALPATSISTPEALVSLGATETLAYLINPSCVWPSNATSATLAAAKGLTLFLPNWPAGAYTASFYLPATGMFVSRTTQTAVNGSLLLPVPSFTEDLFVRIQKGQTATGW